MMNMNWGVGMKLGKILDQYASSYQRWIKSVIRLGINEVLKIFEVILVKKTERLIGKIGTKGRKSDRTEKRKDKLWEDTWRNIK